MSNSKIASQITSHIDFPEIMAKLTMDFSPKDISAWLKSKYKNQKELLVSEASLKIFKSEYLDFYNNIRTDLLQTQMALASNNTDALEEVQGNKDYKKKLLEIVDKELDIKTIIKQMVVRIEIRAEQVFDNIQADPRNIKMDRTLVELMTLLLNMLEKFDLITNGNPEQVNITNNININMVDERINMFYEVFRDCVSQLDYETSLLLTELFTKKMQELKLNEQEIASVDKRLEASYKIENQVQEKLNN